MVRLSDCDDTRCCVCPVFVSEAGLAFTVRGKVDVSTCMKITKLPGKLAKTEINLRAKQ